MEGDDDSPDHDDSEHDPQHALAAHHHLREDRQSNSDNHRGAGLGRIAGNQHRQPGADGLESDSLVDAQRLPVSAMYVETGRPSTGGDSLGEHRHGATGVSPAALLVRGEDPLDQALR